MRFYEDVKTIEAARLASNEAIAKCNLKQLAGYWMDDIIIIRGNSDVIVNKAKAIIAWEKIFESAPPVIYERRPTEIIISNDKLSAWEKGTWTGINTYSKGGNYAAVWKKQESNWKIQAELFASLT